MRILDSEHDKALKNVILYLRLEEAKELMDDLARLIETKNLKDHAHINDQEYKHELTVLIYDENNLSSLDERSKRLIGNSV